MKTNKGYDPQKHNRQSIRCSNFDYSSPGYYFVTIVVQNRINIFGSIYNRKIALNDAGIMVRNVWKTMPQHFFFITMDQFVVMPNHFHGIIKINQPIFTPVGKPLVGFQNENLPDHGIGDYLDFQNKIKSNCRMYGEFPLRKPTRGFLTRLYVPSLFDVIGAFKSITTNRYIDGVKQYNWQPFNKKLWQFQYNDRIIRNQKQLIATRNYIKNHPNE